MEQTVAGGGRDVCTTKLPPVRGGCAEPWNYSNCQRAVGRVFEHLAARKIGSDDLSIEGVKRFG